MRATLALQSTNQKNFEVNKKSQALKVRKALTAKMWKEKENSLRIQIQLLLMFFTVELKWMMYITILL